MKPRESLTILVNDPSLTAWGYCVIRDGKVVKTNCIKTVPENKKRRIRKGDDNVRRVSEIIQVLKQEIENHSVNYLLTELPHGSQSSTGAVMIGVVLGIMETFAQCYQLGIEWYSEGDAKKAILGKISATKQETIDRIKTLYPGMVWMKAKYQNEAVADALAIYHCATLSSSFIKFWNK